MAVVAAQAGETIDALVWRVMGTVAGAVELALGLNPQLLGDVILAEGDSVILPDIATSDAAAPPVRDMIRLWD